MEISEEQREFNRLSAQLTVLEEDMKGLWGDKKFAQQEKINMKKFEIDIVLDTFNANQKALVKRLTSNQT